MLDKDIQTYRCLKNRQISDRSIKERLPVGRQWCQVEMVLRRMDGLATKMATLSFLP